MIRQVLRQKLGFYVSAQGKNENNQDAEDLYQEAITRVLGGLNQLHSPARTDIENFDLYVSRLATNLCIDFLRAKSPARTRLKYRLRDLLKRHNDFTSWEDGGELLCGFASWRNTPKNALSDRSYHDLESKLESFKLLHFADEDIRLASVPQVLAELFDWISGPVEIDVLVRMLAYLLDIKDQPLESFDDSAQANRDTYLVSQSGESHIETNELLAHLWQVVIQLPAEQRDSFALGFKDEVGHDLFTVLLAADIVSWDELAHGMGRSVEEVVRLRLRMPMDSTGIAAELRASRANVYKWRFRALRHLQGELGG
jgi:RNA polymerase sigma factor (sigma-70 family)